MEKFQFNAFNGNSALMGTTAENTVFSGISNRVTKRRRMQLARTLGASVINKTAMVVAAALLGVGVANAATINVTSNADDGDGTLRAAISDATAGDTIAVQAELGTITLASTLLIVDRSVTIKGNGVVITTDDPAVTPIRTGGVGAEVTFERVHFKDMSVPYAAIHNRVKLTLKACIFSGITVNGSETYVIESGFGAIVNEFNLDPPTESGFVHGFIDGSIYAYGCTFSNTVPLSIGSLVEGDGGFIQIVGTIFQTGDVSWAGVNETYYSVSNIQDDWDYALNYDEATNVLLLDEVLCDENEAFIPNNEALPVLPDDLYDLYPDYPVTDFNGTKIVPGESVAGAVVGEQLPEAKPALDSLSISAGELIEFSPDTKIYDVTVDPDVESIIITATAAAGSVITPADTAGAKTLKDGANQFTIHVTKTGEEPVVYTVNVYRKSSNADLATLIVEAPASVTKTLKPAFHPDTLAYTVDVGNATSITIKATPVISSAGVTGIGVALSFPTGEETKTFTVVVTSETGVEKTYKVTVNRGTSGATAVSTQAASLSVYPNPTEGIVHIDNPDGTEAEVYNVQGVLVETRHAASLQSSSSATLDISHLPAGVYVIKVGGKVAKVVKR
jgi:hypothetical protein